VSQGTICFSKGLYEPSPSPAKRERAG
jgi:hypothetical protein